MTKFPPPRFMMSSILVQWKQSETVLHAWLGQVGVAGVEIPAPRIERQDFE